MAHTVGAIDLGSVREHRLPTKPRQGNMNRVAHLAEENARLQRTVAELRLRNILLEEVLSRRA